MSSAGVAETGPTKSARPRCTANATPAGGANTTTLKSSRVFVPLLVFMRQRPVSKSHSGFQRQVRFSIERLFART